MLDANDDLAATSFLADGHDLQVGYYVSGGAAPAFDIGIYASPDGQTAGTLLMTRRITSAGSLAIGSHLENITADFSEPEGDYVLLAKVDCLDEWPEVSSENNQLPFGGGVFQSASGAVHIEGTNAADRVVIAATSTLDVTLNGTVFAFPSAEVTQLAVHTHDGYGLLTLDLGGGNVVPTGGLKFDAGAGANYLRVVHGSLPAATVVNLSEHDGALMLTQSLSINSLALTGAATLETTAGKLVSAQTLSVSGTNNVIDVAGGSLLKVGGFSIDGAATLTKSGSGTFTVSGTQDHGLGAQLYAVAGTTNLDTDAGSSGRNLSCYAQSQGAVDLRSSQHMNVLSISDGNVVTLTAGGAKLLVVNELVIEQQSQGGYNGALDLNNGNLVVLAPEEHFSDAFDAVATQLANGFDDFAWHGAGIRSSSAAVDGMTLSALGVLDNREWLYSIFEQGHFDFSGTGESLPENAVLVKYTYYGDADLDGHVTTSDFDVWLFGYNHVLAGWGNGDCDYSGDVTVSDFDSWLYSHNYQGSTNVAPVFMSTAPPNPLIMNPGDLMFFAATATDTDVASGDLLFSLELPSGFSGTAPSIDAATGDVTWAPDSTVAAGTYDFTIQVINSGTQLSAAQVISITIAPFSAATPPKIVGFKAMPGDDHHWTFSGIVDEDDTDTMGYIVRFDGLLYGNATSVTGVGGEFYYGVTLSTGATGDVTAQTVDGDNLASNIAMVWI